MDRDELIARLSEAANKRLGFRRNHDRSDRIYVARGLLLDAIAALESRPAPTEEHDDRVALDTLSAAMKEIARVRDETKFSDEVPEGERKALRNGATACWVMLNGMQHAILKRYPIGVPNRFATETQPVAGGGQP